MKKILIICVVCLLCLGLTVGASCLTSREFTDVATAIRASIYPVQLNTKLKLQLGPVLLGTANMVVKQVVKDPEVSQYLAEIRKIQVGIYDVRQSQSNTPLNIPSEANAPLISSGWEPFVRVRDNGQSVSLFYKQITDRITGVYVVVLGPENLVVVEVQGHLDDLIEKAIEEQGIPEGFDMM